MEVKFVEAKPLGGKISRGKISTRKSSCGKIPKGKISLGHLVTYLELSFSWELKRETTKSQSKDLLATVVHSGMSGPKRLIDLLDGWRNL